MDVGAIERAASQFDAGRRSLSNSWLSSTPAWNDSRREQMGSEVVQPLLDESSRYARALDEATAMIRRAISVCGAQR